MFDTNAEAVAQAMLERARSGFTNTEALLIRGAYRIASQREIDSWEYTCRNVTAAFAARFIVSKGFTYDEVMQMFS